jgi:hypothetical protein
VVVIPACCDESGLGSVALHQFKPKHATIEGQRSVEVGHLQVNMPDLYTGVDRVIRLTLAHHEP